MLFRVSKTQGTAVLGAVLPGRRRPKTVKGNAQLTSRETLSFTTPTPPVLDARSTSSAHRPLYEGVHVHPWVSPDLDG